MKKLIVSALCAMMAATMFAAEGTKAENKTEAKKKDVVLIVPTHPDDLIAMLGFCHLAKDVYELHVVDYTHGERGCGEEKFKNGWTKAKRTQEEEDVCKRINAKLHWMDEIDGEAYANRETCHKLANLMKELKPRAVIAHWPVDIHTDHVMAGAATIRALFLSGVDAELWFMGQTYQAKRWTPDVLVDISSVYEETVKTARIYECQNQDDGLVESRDTASNYFGKQSRRFYDARCEGFKAYILPMAGDRTIFTDLPQPKNYPQGHTFEGCKD